MVNQQYFMVGFLDQSMSRGLMFLRPHWDSLQAVRMKEVAIYEAKTRLSELVLSVEAGEQVTITRRGQAVARLVGMGSPKRGASNQKQRVAQVFDALRLRRKTVNLDLPLRQAIEQGRD